MTEEQYKKLNNIIENFICNHDIFLVNNLNFFYNLYKSKKIIYVEIEQFDYQKSSATETFKKIEEYYNTFFPENLVEIKEAFNNGKFDIKYQDENLEYDDNYISGVNNTRFYENSNIINIPLYGNTSDIMITAHEIRHHLNNPKTSRRNIINDLITESLSQFEEYLILEYYYNKGDITPNDRKKYYEKQANKFIGLRNQILFIIELIIVKQNLGNISAENYKFLFNYQDEFFKDNCTLLLNTTPNFEQINQDMLGHFLSNYMIEQYENTDNFIEKFKNLNNQLFQNPDIDCLNTIGLDFNNLEDVNNKLLQSMEHTENKLLKGKTI